MIDSRTDIVLTVQHAFHRIGARVADSEAIGPLIGKPLKDYPRLLGYQITPEQNADFVQAYRTYYAEHMNDNTRLYPGVRETLETFKQRSLKLAVVTTKRQDQAELVVERMGLASYIDHVRGWLETRKNKPDPEPVLDALQALGAQPEQGLMIGDSEQDIMAAQAAHVDSCACLYGFRDPDYLRSLNPTYTVGSFPEILDLVLPAGDSR